MPGRSAPTGVVRIIGGAWRRRLLRFPAADGLRPSPDRVRETVFNWLGQDLDGLSCLDLFAGSGAFGLEAASRGARRVVLVEQAPAVVVALRANAALLGAGSRVEVQAGDALQFAAACAERFDVVFLDPPYRAGLLERLLPFLPRLTHDETRLYVESGKPVPTLGAWHAVRAGKAGQVHYQLLVRGSEAC